MAAASLPASSAAGVASWRGCDHLDHREPQDSGDGWGSLRSRAPWWFSFIAFNGGFYGLCVGGFTRYNEEPSLLDVF